jgi:FdhD protein
VTTAHERAPAVRPVDVLRVDGSRAERHDDRVAVESALAVRLGGEAFSVIMRTPGDDRNLTLGFLLTESVIDGRSDVVRVDVDPDANAVDVTLAPARAGRARDALAGRRQVVMNSSCGMCGRRSLESLDVNGSAYALDWQVSQAVVRSLPDGLASAQSAFAETGGLHAAGLFDLEGRLLASAEDVGRHNAVDKLLGRMLDENRLPLDRALLFVSGRSSFEIIQKAWLGGIRFVAAVSAPSSLAVDLARESGMTLLGFVREGRFNVYAHEGRLAGERS